MLTYDDWKKHIDRLRDEAAELEWRIEYRKLEIRKTFSINDPRVNTAGTTTGTICTANAQITSAVSSMFNTPTLESVCEQLYRTDEKLANLQFKLKRVNDARDFLRKHGALPE